MADEVRVASQILKDHYKLPEGHIRFKVVDLAEPAKNEVFQYFENPACRPDRRVRIYYQRKDVHILTRAIVNITCGVVEEIEELPDSQGPVDWLEYDLIHDRCINHPLVLAEVAKLKLPKG